MHLLAHSPRPTDSPEQREQLAQMLADVPGLVVLHDRMTPGSRANIDYLVVGPCGVFVIDAKAYRGRITVRDRGGLLRTDLRLYVGRRDCSTLADGARWQADTVLTAFRSAGITPPRVTPILCFVDGDWPSVRRPTSFRGVRLESSHSVARRLVHESTLDPNAIVAIGQFLALAFPAK